MMNVTIPDSVSAVPAAVALAGMPDMGDDDVATVAIDRAPAKPPCPKSTSLTYTALVNRASLLTAVTAAARAVEKRHTIPVLANLLLRAADGGVSVIGTDLDIFVSAPADGAADPEFSTTVPAHVLADVLKKAKASEIVTIDVKREVSWREPHKHEREERPEEAWVPVGDESVSLDFDGLRVNLHGVAPTDFPITPPGAMTHTFEVPTAALADAMGRTFFAISTEETRYYLNGVYMHRSDDGDTLRFVATDGHRLARYDMPSPAGLTGTPSGIVRRGVAALLHKACKVRGAPATVQVEMNPAWCRFTVGNVAYLSKLIDGTFPDYGRVIPVGNDKHVTIDRQALSAGIEQVCVIASERGRAVKLSLFGEQLRLSVTNPDTGSARTDVAVTYSGDPIETGFNSRYLLDILDQVASKDVTLSLADPGSPALIRGTGDDDKPVVFVLMPMRV